MSEINKNVPHVAGHDSLEAEGRVGISHDPRAASDDRKLNTSEWTEHGSAAPYHGEWVRYAQPTIRTAEQVSDREDSINRYQREDRQG